MGLIKLATPGPGFAALQRIGLAGKALADPKNASWLKTTAKEIPSIVNGVSSISHLPIKPVLTREAFLGGAKGGRVMGNTIGQFITPFTKTAGKITPFKRLAQIAEKYGNDGANAYQNIFDKYSHRPFGSAIALANREFESLNIPLASKVKELKKVTAKDIQLAKHPRLF